MLYFFSYYASFLLASCFPVTIGSDGAIPDVTFGTKRRNEAIYSDSEATLLENTLRVRQLVGELEKKEANKNEA